MKMSERDKQRDDKFRRIFQGSLAIAFGAAIGFIVSTVLALQVIFTGVWAVSMVIAMLFLKEHRRILSRYLCPREIEIDELRKSP